MLKTMDNVQNGKWSSAKRVFEKCVVKITVKTLMLIDL